MVPGCGKSLQWLSKELKHLIRMKNCLLYTSSFNLLSCKSTVESGGSSWHRGSRDSVSLRERIRARLDVHRSCGGKVGRTGHTLVSYLTVWVSFDPTPPFSSSFSSFPCPPWPTCGFIGQLSDVSRSIILNSFPMGVSSVCRNTVSYCLLSGQLMDCRNVICATLSSWMSWLVRGTHVMNWGVNKKLVAFRLRDG